MWAAPRDDHNRIFLALMAALVAVAWLALWLSGRSHHYGDSLGFLHFLHDITAFDGSGAFMLVFIAGWTVMVVAMMLPTSLPLISLFRGVARQRPDRALLVAGYLAVWILFGVLVYLGGWALRLLVERSAWLEANGWILGAGVLLLAGVYQFTPLKYKCLEKCRSPLSFITEHWRGSRERSRSFRLGAHHGLFCVGCCWSLMLLMFLVGTGGTLLWMLVLGAVIAVEKNVSWGRRIGVPLGVVLVGLGLTVGAAQAFDDTSARVSLAPANDSHASGVVIFTDTPDGLEVKLDVEGLPRPGAMYLAHIHPGSCAEETAGGTQGHDHHGHHDEADEPAGEIEHPLTPIVPDSGDGGSSATVIQGATVAELFSGGEFYMNVHSESSGSEELPDSVVCGDLRKLG